jgi:hypothetical protein
MRRVVEGCEGDKGTLMSSGMVCETTVVASTIDVSGGSLEVEEPSCEVKNRIFALHDNETSSHSKEGQVFVPAKDYWMECVGVVSFQTQGKA